MISIPYWLRSILQSLNWDIFTWRVYVGDAILDALEWIISWLNYGIDLAGEAYQLASQALSEALEEADRIRRVLLSEIYDIWDEILTWPAQLRELGELILFEASRILDDSVDWLLDKISNTYEAIQNTQDRLSDFFRNTLPSLVDLDLLDLSLRSLQRDIEARLAPITELKQTVESFLANPFDYLLDKFAEWWLGKE